MRENNLGSVCGKTINYSDLFKSNKFIESLITNVDCYKYVSISTVNIEFFEKSTCKPILLMFKICDYMIINKIIPTSYDIIKMFPLHEDMITIDVDTGCLIDDAEIVNTILPKRINNFIVGNLREVYTLYQISQLYPMFTLYKKYKADASKERDFCIYDPETGGEITCSIKHDGFGSRLYNNSKKNKKDFSEIRIIIPNDKSNKGLHHLSLDELKYKLDDEYNIGNRIKNKTTQCL